MQWPEKRREYNNNKECPQTEIKVNKEYDKNGNLVRFDSSYSYYYSNVAGDTVLQDSILNAFKAHFNQHYFFSNEPFFNDFSFRTPC
jgi:hypothetical protein